MAPYRSATQTSHASARLHQAFSGHIAKANRCTQALCAAGDTFVRGDVAPRAVHGAKGGQAPAPASPMASEGSNTDLPPGVVPPKQPAVPSFQPVPPSLPSVRIAPHLTDAQLVGAAIGADDAQGWMQALHAVDFDLSKVCWLPSDYPICLAACLNAAARFERAGNLLEAGGNYVVVDLVARYAMQQVFGEGSGHYTFCQRAQDLSQTGAQRCTEALQKLTPATPETPGTEAKLQADALARMPDQVRTLVQREIDRLNSAPGGSETDMARRYIDWCIALPWNQPHPHAIDVKEARRILDADHQGLEKVKARILEEIAVQKRLGKPTGKVICLVGPSGVGKTSVVKSIAHALGKQLLRQALGGVSDEMEIRGNNRAYTGAQPGRIIQEMCRAGHSDPVFLLDEIDKVVRQTHRGDPSAALLELLDPEQNHAFKDAYLGFGYDLSEVTFIATANYIDDIPVALRDRLEIITLSGYTPIEKQSIGRTHLIPKQMAKNKLDASHLTISEAALAYVIKYYTQEPGVRELEKQIASICRKVVTRLESDEQTDPVVVEPDSVAALLGPQRYRETTRLRQSAPGVVNGLAWTQAGGVILPVEARAHKRAGSGDGKLVLTGNVRKVMEESATIASNFLRTSYPAISDALTAHDLYLHLPAGAVEKDGPSGGVTLVTAMVAALTRHAVPDDTAMTGEVGLFGEVWPVGGIKEKSMAAYGAGCKRLFLPKANEVDLEDVPAEVKDNLEIVLVEHVSDLLRGVFGPISELAATSDDAGPTPPSVTEVSVPEVPRKV